MNLRKMLQQFGEQYHTALDKEAFLNNFMNAHFYEAHSIYNIMDLEKERASSKEELMNFRMRQGLMELGLIIGGQKLFNPQVVSMTRETDKEFHFERVDLKVICVRNVR